MANIKQESIGSLLSLKINVLKTVAFKTFIFIPLAKIKIKNNN